ncbi:MAG: endonuclease/exonuclease/phosphatase family protein [Acidimicrobiia bacterium]
MSPSRLTVGSYNLEQGRRGGWHRLPELVAAHDVDVMLLQEASRPARLPEQWDCHPSPDDPDRWRISIPPYYQAANGELRPTQRRYASAIVATGARPVEWREPMPLQETFDGGFACSHPGQFAVGVMALEEGIKLTLVSLYGLWDRMLDSGSLYPDATLHRAISDLAVVFQEVDAGYVLVGGDLNVYSYTDGSTWADRAVGVLDRLRDYGLEICGPFRPAGARRLDRCRCPDTDCRCEVTFLYQANPANRPHQLDFFLATPALRERLVACWADPDPEWYRHSDHRAIFARFDI